MFAAIIDIKKLHCDSKPIATLSVGDGKALEKPRSVHQANGLKIHYSDAAYTSEQVWTTDGRHLRKCEPGRTSTSVWLPGDKRPEKEHFAPQEDELYCLPIAPWLEATTDGQRRAAPIQTAAQGFSW
jgi:hypothetical protein